MKPKLYFAHSGISSKNIKPQTYYDHVSNVYDHVKNNVFIFNDKLKFLKQAVLIASLYHDLGKLDDHSQPILSSRDKIEDVKMLNHVEAGVVFCLNKYKQTKNSTYLYAAYLIHAHHIGLLNQDKLFDTGCGFNRKITLKDSFKCNKDISDYIENQTGTINEYIKSQIENYISIHNSILIHKVQEVANMDLINTNYIPTAMDLRFALSILVDADHLDTSIHYGMVTRSPNTLQPKKRIHLLNTYVDKIKTNARKNGVSDEVIESRNVLLESCRNTPLNTRFYSCFGPTGKGKTISSMLLALRLAEKYNLNKINYVIPFTNIIDQSVSVYQDALIDKTDNVKHNEYIVNPIHSMCDFDHWWLRKYSHLWDCPINVSTSVQFFESLFSNKTSRLRKIKNFANSVVVFDEYHTAMPHEYWNLALAVLKEISEKFNICFVFSSGTQILYWCDIFDSHNIEITDIVDDNTFDSFKQFENKRVRFFKSKKFNHSDKLYRWIESKAFDNKRLKYNTCVVMNTVLSASTVAKYFRQKYPNIIVKHMSSAITPKDRKKILASIHDNLKNGKKVMLIATSVVECGIDFSFQLGFREHASLESTIQFGGRINRNNEYEWGKVFEFELNKKFIKESDEFSYNPGIEEYILSRSGLEIDPDNCTASVKNSLFNKDVLSLLNNNNRNNFEDVSENFRVINSPTIQVIVYPEIIAKMREGEIVAGSEISMNSVNLYDSKLKKLEDKWTIETIGNKDFHVWIGDYDPDFYGIYV